MSDNLCKVFISYAHNSEQHKDIILKYSNELINPGGLDCWIDRYVEDAIIPDGWPNWMRKKVNESDFVIVVCCPTYHARFEKNPDQERKGLGAKFESTLIL
ncbi:MAG: SEFIR domain-containing protein, partial [Chryseolinea sp.]